MKDQWTKLREDFDAVTLIKSLFMNRLKMITILNSVADSDITQSQYIDR